MNYGEFISDHYRLCSTDSTLKGFLVNRVPLLNKLNWRLLATGNGSSEECVPVAKPDCPTYCRWSTNPGRRVFYRQTLCGLGYGVENIFRFLRGFHSPP